LWDVFDQADENLDVAQDVDKVQPIIVTTHAAAAFIVFVAVQVVIIVVLFAVLFVQHYHQRKYNADNCNANDHDEYGLGQSDHRRFIVPTIDIVVVVQYLAQGDQG
jgi:hypothetical protein